MINKSRHNVLKGIGIGSIALLAIAMLIQPVLASSTVIEAGDNQWHTIRTDLVPGNTYTITFTNEFWTSDVKPKYDSGSGSITRIVTGPVLHYGQSWTATFAAGSSDLKVFLDPCGGWIGTSVKIDVTP